jgi:uncharacterized protein (UPF0333 family)
MKIAIVGLFRKFDPGYALAVGWLERAKMLEYYKQDFEFFVQENCTTDIYPNVRKVVPVMKGEWDFPLRAKAFQKFFEEYMPSFDVILTSDLIYQKRDPFLAANQGMRWAQKNLPGKRWYHWMHSGYCLPYRCEYPETLRFQGMPDSFIVNMNKTDIEGVSKMYNVPIENVKCVYNPKDFRSFNNFQPISWEITRKLNIQEKRIVQIFPFCTTRLKSKGLYDVTLFFSILKKMGHPVALVLANSHAAQVPHIMAHEKMRIRQLGLIEGEDYLWTSDYTENQSPLPREAVSDLFKCSNLFIFGSWRENCPNVLLEAKIGGVLCVLNANNRVLSEFSHPNCIWYDGDSKTPGIADGLPNEITTTIYRDGKMAYFTEIAKKIVENVPDLSYKWEYSYERIWEEQMRPMLYE